MLGFNRRLVARYDERYAADTHTQFFSSPLLPLTLALSLVKHNRTHHTGTDADPDAAAAAATTTTTITQQYIVINYTSSDS